MASFTTSSVCFPFQGVDSSNGVPLGAFTGRASSSHVFTFRDAIANGFLGLKGNQARHEIRGGRESEYLHKTTVRSILQQAPVLEISERPDSGATLLDLSSSSNLEETPTIDSLSNKAGSQGRMSVISLIKPVSLDLEILNRNLHMVVGSENPMLMAAAEQIFSAGGKRMRPALVLLAARATAQLAGLEDLTSQHRRLAEVIEMIHTASLIHDDVIDESEVRRGKKTIHQLYGTRVAVLAGDFLFAQSSWYLASLENIEVIKLISQVIKDLASGEIKQASGLFDCDTTLQDYLEKSYYKTASLVAASMRSAAIFSGVAIEVCDKMFSYGKNLGLAFQIVDDILDFTRSTEQLGKPAGSDLCRGNLTAPVLFSLEKESELRALIDSEFTEEGSLEEAIRLVQKGGGIDKARNLAKERGEDARQNLECLPFGIMRSSLEGMVDYVLERLF